MADDHRREIGAQGEEWAVAYLVGSGWEVLARNWRCSLGELDLVARRALPWPDDRPAWLLAVVEVKTRRAPGGPPPQASVTRAKRAKLVQLARAFRAAHGGLERAVVRFDVLAIDQRRDQATITHFEGAFDGEGRLA